MIDNWLCMWEELTSWYYSKHTEVQPSAAPVTRFSGHTVKMIDSVASCEADDHSRLVLKGEGFEMKDGHDGEQEELKRGHS